MKTIFAACMALTISTTGCDLALTTPSPDAAGVARGRLRISALPPVALAGAVVRIDGVGFKPSAGDNMVLFNGVPQLPLGASSEALFVEVPGSLAPAGDEPLSVVVTVLAGDDQATATTTVVALRK
jgi:hypothetical protein